MEKLSDYLTITEAAAYLGVAPNTLRNWGRDGRLAEQRHPVNGYRLYSREQLDAILRQVATPRRRATAKRKPR
jgi:excisionase family DNA binding protein